MPRSAVWVFRVVVSTAAVVAFYWWCVVPFDCNRAIRDVRLRSEAGIRSASETRTRVSALTNIARLERSCRGCTNVNIDLLMAYNTEALGNDEATLAHLNDALRLEPRPEIYFDRALTQLSLRNVDAAVDDFATATRFDPYTAERIDASLLPRVQERMARQP